MSRRSCSDRLESGEALDPSPIHAAHEVTLEGPTGFAGGEAFGLASREIRLSGGVDPRLGEDDPVEEHVEAAIPAPVEPMADRSGAGGLKWRESPERREGLLAESRAGAAKFGDERAGGERGDALDLPQGGKARLGDALKGGPQFAFLVTADRQPPGLRPRQPFTRPAQPAL